MSASRLILAFICCLLSVPTNAATLQITELQDVNLGEVPLGTDRVRQRMRFCVAMNPGGPFQITAFGNQVDGRFVLSNGLGLEQGISFDLYASSRARGRGRRLTPGFPLTGLNARPPRPNGECRPPFVQMRVIVDRNDLRTAGSGRYSAQIELTVAPE
ncbi:MAG: hypothetical protein AAF993_00485 [Pseudomonadota bacterium]